MPTVTKEITTKELSAIYDRIYNIADRLFKKYDPCNIRKRGNKVICDGGNKPTDALCCKD